MVYLAGDKLTELSTQGGFKKTFIFFESTTVIVQVSANRHSNNTLYESNLTMIEANLLVTSSRLF